ncbi:hypothetical protein [Bacillus stercoris]|uniref:hypothetical protein n=1 Tax=Bacillus stercoris TaxID=2054641 RepID=UPI002DBE6A16|nr:hypothetical protein [Bacillus stercoris]MEC3613813.1 hypothetical protein [Bacillus stercoris]
MIQNISLLTRRMSVDCMDGNTLCVDGVHGYVLKLRVMRRKITIYPMKSKAIGQEGVCLKQ